MRLSKFFLPTLKEKPSEAKITSHALMLRSGMIRQQAAGIYSWLPLGIKVLNNISNIVRKSMSDAGCIELLMPCVQPAELWLESGRYDIYGKEMLQFSDRHDSKLLFGPTNEEMITDIVRNNIQSYKDFPKNLFHIQWKFRDEIRPRFGVMRGREFLMKDAYSFDIDYQEAIISYNKMYETYMHCFKQMGLKAIPVKADSGPIGGDMNHEFHIIAQTGESTIYYDQKFEELAANEEINVQELQSLYATADEKHSPENCPLDASDLRVSKSIEVGHIFYFGTKYSVAMKAMVNDQNGALVPLEMGSYGIGISRLVAAIIESSHDERGIIWPVSVAPFKLSLINLNPLDALCNELSEKLYKFFHNEKKLEVIYDDTNERPGSKFATHDLIGSPWQIIIGPKNAILGLVEVKNRQTGVIVAKNYAEAIEGVIKALNV